MAQSSLNRNSREIYDDKAGIIIVNDLGDIVGGRSLDVSNVASGTTVIEAGWVIKKTSAGEYAPLGLSGTSYASLSEGESYVGILKKSVLVADPRAAILTIGQVNAAACPVAITSTIASGLPRIEFLNL